MTTVYRFVPKANASSAYRGEMERFTLPEDVEIGVLVLHGKPDDGLADLIETNCDRLVAAATAENYAAFQSLLPTRLVYFKRGLAAWANYTGTP